MASSEDMNVDEMLSIEQYVYQFEFKLKTKMCLLCLFFYSTVKKVFHIF